MTQTPTTPWMSDFVFLDVTPYCAMVTWQITFSCFKCAHWGRKAPLKQNKTKNVAQNPHSTSLALSSPQPMQRTYARIVFACLQRSRSLLVNTVYTYSVVTYTLHWKNAFMFWLNCSVTTKKKLTNRLNNMCQNTLQGITVFSSEDS